jgi:hypothetical protein
MVATVYNQSNFNVVQIVTPPHPPPSHLCKISFNITFPCGTFFFQIFLYVRFFRYNFLYITHLKTRSSCAIPHWHKLLNYCNDIQQKIQFVMLNIEYSLCHLANFLSLNIVIHSHILSALNLLFLKFQVNTSLQPQHLPSRLLLSLKKKNSPLPIGVFLERFAF